MELIFLDLEIELSPRHEADLLHHLIDVLGRGRQARTNAFNSAS